LSFVVVVAAIAAFFGNGKAHDEGSVRAGYKKPTSGIIKNLNHLGVNG
jgi:hypothetical protein